MNKDSPIGYSQFGTPVVIWKENLAADQINVICSFFQPPIWLQSEDGKIQKLLTAYHHAIIHHTHRQIDVDLLQLE